MSNCWKNSTLGLCMTSWKIKIFIFPPSWINTKTAFKDFMRKLIIKLKV